MQVRENPIREAQGSLHHIVVGRTRRSWEGKKVVTSELLGWHGTEIVPVSTDALCDAAGAVRPRRDCSGLVAGRRDPGIAAG